MNRRHLLRAAMLPTPALLSACAQAVAPAGVVAGQQALSLPLPGRAAAQPLLLALPPGYDDEPQRQWPLVVFLHGSGERGSELARVAVHGLPMQVRDGARLPFILCSPLLEAEGDWDAPRLHALLAALRAGWRVDPDRVLATGLSRGGRGCWRWAAAYPRDLAGIAPVCGNGDPATVCQARGVPVRAYHGELDTVVPLALHQASVDALRACGGTVSFTVYPGVGHDSWTPAYRDPGLLPWLLAQRRSPA